MSELLNRMIAGRLDEVAAMLRRRGADPVYVRDYGLAASAVRHWPISMAVMYKHRGIEGLEEVPGVGAGIARVIRRLLTHHRRPPVAARPGQYVHVRSGGPSAFVMRHPFAVNTVERGSGKLTLYVSEDAGGAGWLLHGGAGSTVDLIGPLGRGFELDPRSRHLLLVAAGDGSRTATHDLHGPRRRHPFDRRHHLHGSGRPERQHASRRDAPARGHGGTWKLLRHGVRHRKPDGDNLVHRHRRAPVGPARREDLI